MNYVIGSCLDLPRGRENFVGGGAPAMLPFVKILRTVVIKLFVGHRGQKACLLPFARCDVL